jgi:RNA polymerase-binding transcription factor DksA
MRNFDILETLNLKHMNETFIQESKAKLEAERKRLLKILGKEGIEDGTGEFPGDFKPKFTEVGREDGENASEVEQYANDLGEIRALEERLNKIEAALQRIAAGTYGKDASGNDIPEDRLRAVPEAES